MDMTDPPPTFPYLPQDTSYPANVLTTRDTISEIYQCALQISACEDANLLQSSFHCDAIKSDALPLLEAIGEDPSITDYSLRDWLVVATMALASVAARLQNYHASLSNRYTLSI